MKISDSQLYARLAALLDGTGTVLMTPASPNAQEYCVEVKAEVHDNHRGDSPDVILQLTISLNHSALPPLNLQVPIPIEGEKAGIGAALDDLRKFAERDNFPQKLPMLVVGGSGNPARRVQMVKIAAKFEIVQVPYRSLSE